MTREADPLVVLLPVFDDWSAALLLLPRIIEQLKGRGSFGILIVDDGSTETSDLQHVARAEGLAWVRVLALKRNIGHQRAIAVGLSYIDEHVPCEAVVVMDADGEDRPEDVPRLVELYQQERRVPIVFAERRRRLESLRFRAFYALYRLLHRILTGKSIRFGNFSIIPRKRLSSLVVVSELWIHYAASAVRSRQPMCTLQSSRGVRISGRSRMQFVTLVVHGLSAVAVYSDVVFTRLITATGCLAALSLVGLLAVMAVRLGSNLAIPGWATYASGMLLLVLLQAVTFVISLTFLILGARQHATVIPRRDYGFFVAGVSDIPLSSAT
jgi:polyisoprenyl-phosphate glycosyltransferase